MPGRLYTLLHEHAVDQFGYITTRDAEELGVDPHRLQQMMTRGVLTHVDRGIFRFDDVPAGPLDQYAEATLWPLEVQGVLSHATALDLHGLCDINPAHIDITVPRASGPPARRRRSCACIARRSTSATSPGTKGCRSSTFSARSAARSTSTWAGT